MARVHGEVDPEQKAAWCQGAPGPAIWQPDMSGPAVPVKVLTYNLYWWSLFRLRHSNGGSAANLIAHTDAPEYDMMGFQECEDVKFVLVQAHLQDKYAFTLGQHGLCMAWNSATWRPLAQGEDHVAEDSRIQYYGVRDVIWARLAHRQTGKVVLFVNHHGPLPVNSGGMCGGVATAGNILRAIQKHGQPGDAVILVGDFNSNLAAVEIHELQAKMHHVFHGNADGGVDNIFSNVPLTHATDLKNIGSGGSDHDALTATIHIEPGPGHAPPVGVSVTTGAPGTCHCKCDWAAKPNACKLDDGSCCYKTCCAAGHPVAPAPQVVV